MMGLTQRQSECLSAIRSYVDETGRSPSFGEIAEAIGTSSKSRVTELLLALEERGAIRRLPNRARSIEVVPQDQTRAVVVSADLWAPLIRYAIAEKINLETAVNSFIRDGLESA